MFSVETFLGIYEDKSDRSLTHISYSFEKFYLCHSSSKDLKQKFQ